MGRQVKLELPQSFMWVFCFLGNLLEPLIALNQFILLQIHPLCMTIQLLLLVLMKQMEKDVLQETMAHQQAAAAQRVAAPQAVVAPVVLLAQVQAARQAAARQAVAVRLAIYILSFRDS